MWVIFHWLHDEMKAWLSLKTFFFKEINDWVEMGKNNILAELMFHLLIKSPDSLSKAQCGWSQHDFGHLSTSKFSWMDHVLHYFTMGIMKVKQYDKAFYQNNCSLFINILNLFGLFYFFFYKNWCLQINPQTYDVFKFDFSLTCNFVWFVFNH